MIYSVITHAFPSIEAISNTAAEGPFQLLDGLRLIFVGFIFLGYVLINLLYTCIITFLDLDSSMIFGLLFIKYKLLAKSSMILLY